MTALRSYVALLRGVNVGGRNAVPMARLREAVGTLGWSDVATYIQSGNVMFRTDRPLRSLESDFEEVIEDNFGLSIPVVVREAGRWAKYVKENPFPGESEAEAKWVLLALSKKSPAASAVAELEGKAANGERVMKVGDGIWIHFPEGSGRSKLTPTVLDRVIGSPATTRNWRTVLKLEELVREAG